MTVHMRVNILQEIKFIFRQITVISSKIQLDSALKETVVYAPSGSFEYRIPTEVLERIYEEGAFAGTEHRIRVSEATDKEAYGERNISLNPYDLQGQKDVIRTHMRIM